MESAARDLYPQIIIMRITFSTSCFFFFRSRNQFLNKLFDRNRITTNEFMKTIDKVTVNIISVVHENILQNVVGWEVGGGCFCELTLSADGAQEDDNAICMCTVRKIWDVRQKTSQTVLADRMTAYWRVFMKVDNRVERILNFTL